MFGCCAPCRRVLIIDGSACSDVEKRIQYWLNHSDMTKGMGRARLSTYQDYNYSPRAIKTWVENDDDLRHPLRDSHVTVLCLFPDFTKANYPSCDVFKSIGSRTELHAWIDGCTTKFDAICILRVYTPAVIGRDKDNITDGSGPKRVYDIIKNERNRRDPRAGDSPVNMLYLKDASKEDINNYANRIGNISLSAGTPNKRNIVYAAVDYIIRRGRRFEFDMDTDHYERLIRSNLSSGGPIYSTLPLFSHRLHVPEPVYTAAMDEMVRWLWVPPIPPSHFNVWENAMATKKYETYAQLIKRILLELDKERNQCCYPFNPCAS